MSAFASDSEMNVPFVMVIVGLWNGHLTYEIKAKDADIKKPERKVRVFFVGPAGLEPATN